MSAFRSFCLALLTLTALLAGGCSAYHLGSPGKLPFTTLHVSLAEDRSFTPQSRALLTSQLIEELNRSGRVTVVSDPLAAEAQLSITLVSADRETTVTQPDDTGRPRKLDRTLTVELTLKDASGKKLWLDHAEVSVDRFVHLSVEQGLTNAEYQALPEATKALATSAARAVLSVW